MKDDEFLTSPPQRTEPFMCQEGLAGVVHQRHDIDRRVFAIEHLTLDRWISRRSYPACDPASARVLYSGSVSHCPRSVLRRRIVQYAWILCGSTHPSFVAPQSPDLLEVEQSATNGSSLGHRTDHLHLMLTCHGTRTPVWQNVLNMTQCERCKLLNLLWKAAPRLVVAGACRASRCT